jgi:N-acetylglutamate synthase-like GNAT family acetyltransferase/SAM-dependent methyltransferase
MTTENELKEIVRQTYAEIALQTKKTNMASCCGAGGCSNEVYNIMSESYDTLEGYNPDADLGLGCGLPTQFAQIKKGDVVIDLGSGAGNDCFVARAETGETGKVIGVDFTEAMIGRARQNAEKRGFNNVEFRQGDIEKMPVSDNVADVIVSNCVLNLVPNKPAVFAEMMRVLKPDGHFSISDIVLVGHLPDEIKAAAEMYAGCVSGAIQKDEYLEMIRAAGFKNMAVQKEKPIIIPDDILINYLTANEIDTFKNSHVGIFSITVYAEKPAHISSNTIKIQTAKATDFDNVKSLLTSSDLPTDDLELNLTNFLLAFSDDQLVGVAGVDVVENIGLLRSVAVDLAYRNHKIAQRLITDLTRMVALQGVKTLYLLTTSADGYFQKLGYERIERTDAPQTIQQTAQFKGLCPSSAVIMSKNIEKPVIKLSDLQNSPACCSPNSGCC